MTREADPTRAYLFQALLLGAMTIYTGKSGLTTALRVKLTEVLYVPRIRQWCLILRIKADTFGVVDLCHSKGTLPAGGELIHSFRSKNVLDHRIAHHELSTMHEPLVIVSERLTVPCILESWSCAASSYA
jgi:hypothetical protein